MSFLAFLRANFRWIAGGFLLTFFSSYGQTFIIALFAGNIREEFGLSHGGWGTLYMVATLASAFTMPRLGQVVDRYPARTVSMAVIAALAAGCALLALSYNLAMLVVAMYMLRLFGQGMMGQIAFTAAGRWFVAQRGRALGLTVIGVNAGEALLPLLFVFAATAVGWRETWLVAAATLLLLALPLITKLVAVERQPLSADPPSVPRLPVRDWTRRELLRDRYFYLILVGAMAPGFIGTIIFFHQIHLVELRGWSQQLFASSFPVMAAFTVTSALVSGQLIDRFSATALLPFFVLPLGGACLVIAFGEAQWTNFVFMAMIGMSFGANNTIFGALWPEVYGTAHLGAIRALVLAVMVFATAMGPGISGYLIDVGIALPAQVGVAGIYCFAASLLMVYVSRRLLARRVAG